MSREQILKLAAALAAASCGIEPGRAGHTPGARPAPAAAVPVARPAPTAAVPVAMRGGDFRPPPRFAAPAGGPNQDRRERPNRARRGRRPRPAR
jgi:hypothetical protein